MALKDAFVFVEKLGILDVLLPFILIFTLVFAVFERLKILGNTGNPRTYNAMVSFVLALIFIYSQERVSIMNIILLKFTLLLVASVMVFLIMGTVIDKPAFKNHWWIAAILAMITLIATSTMNWFNLGDILSLLKFFINPVVIGVLFFVLVIWFITKPNKTERALSSTSSSSAPKPNASASKPNASSSSGTPGTTGQKVGSYKPEEGKDWRE